MKGYKDLPNINSMFVADYIKGIKRQAKRWRKEWNSTIRPGESNFDKMVSKKLFRLLEKGGFEVMNFISVELRHQFLYINNSLVTRPLFNNVSKEALSEVGIHPMFLSNMVASLYLSRMTEEEILKHNGGSEQAHQLVKSLLGCFEHDAWYVKANWNRRSLIPYESLEMIKRPYDSLEIFNIDSFLEKPFLLFDDYTSSVNWFVKDPEDDCAPTSLCRRTSDLWQSQFSLLNIFGLHDLKNSGAYKEMSHPKLNDGKPMKVPYEDAYNDFLTQSFMSITDFMNINYFYNSPKSERIVIYPDSAELLEDILDAEYHIDGIHFSEDMQSFVLMIPEGFSEKISDLEDESAEINSMYVSVASGYEVEAQSARSAASFLRSQGCESLGWAWDEQAKLIDLGGDQRFYGPGGRKKPEDGPAYVFEQQQTPMYSSDMTEEELSALTEHYKNDAYSYRSKCLIISGDRQSWTIPLCLAQVILLAEAGDARAREFAETHSEFLIPEGLKIVRLVASVLIYIKALGDEVLHRGVPNKKNNRAGLLEKTSPTKSNNPKTFTLKGPKGYTGRKQGSHYRRWHFRTLKHERYYQTAEWAGKPVGSRVVFVRDSFVNKEVCPHVLTDGTNVEEKVISPESVLERN